MLRGSLSAAGGAPHWLDRIITGALLFLIVFTPLALGSVYQWSIEVIEITGFAMVIAWMAKVALEAGGPLRGSIKRAEIKRLLIPLALLIGLISVQLIPMPPVVMRTLSPATYRLYQVAFPGWPKKSPYGALIAAWKPKPDERQQASVGAVLPAVRANGTESAAKPDNAAKERPAMPGGAGDARWRSLSISPTVTASGLIELFGYIAIFFVAMLYPVGMVGEREAEARFNRRLLVAILVMGAAVALLGLVERASWNGRILWVFIPRDWGQPLLTNAPRASGPFVNPDHFANYLAMILPLALVGAIFTLPIVSSERRYDLKTGCAVASVVILAAILLSLSRGGWLATILGACVAISICLSRAWERAPQFLQRFGSKSVPIAIGGFAAVVLLVLVLLGANGRSYIGNRVGATIMQGQNLSYRPIVWKETLTMVRDFPLFGVGLGCWPEIFPHYQIPPWIPYFFREAENDYVQFAAETGLLGFGLLVWIGWEIVRRLRMVEGFAHHHWPEYAALVGGIGAMALHELMDFNLHTPANAVLFAILLGLALRMVVRRGAVHAAPSMRAVSTRPDRVTATSGVVTVLAILLIVASLIGNVPAYPYDIGTPQTFAGAERAVANHPADSEIHLTLAELMPPEAPPALQREELAAAVWLDPDDPTARDLYARSLLLAGRKKAGLAQISDSVADSPVLDNHYYLRNRLIPWLLPDEQAAIAKGFARAVAAGYSNSHENFARFYEVLGNYRAAGKVYAEAAAGSQDFSVQIADMLRAGRNFAKGGDYATARKILTHAITVDPLDARPYSELAIDVFGPTKNIAAARQILADGKRTGADPAALDMALGRAANLAGDRTTAEAALHDAMRLAPTYKLSMELGDTYFADGRYDSATLSYQQAVQLNPQSAEAFFHLAQAEQASFDYGAAARDYENAIRLSPNNSYYRSTYRSFQRHTAKSAHEAVSGD